jgi:hypothetical protein
MEPEEEKIIAGKTAECWNILAKTHGWPTRKGARDILHSRRVIRRLKEELAHPENLPGITDKEAISWILSRWNWQKTTAPMGMLESREQWKSLRDVLARLQEERQEAEEIKHNTLSLWLHKEFNLRLQKGLSPEGAKKDIEQFSLATRKFQSLSTDEKLFFCQSLEDLVSDQTHLIK